MAGVIGIGVDIGFAILGKWKSQEVKMGRLGSKGSSLAAVMELLGSRLVGVYIVSWR